MSQNGSFPGGGYPDPQQPRPNPANPGPGAWPGGPGNYPPPGGAQPAQGWGQQPPSQPSAPQPGPGWGQQPQQPGQYGPGPYGTAQQPAYGAPQQWGGPPPSSGSPGGGNSKRLLIGLIAAAVGLALIGGVVWFVRNNNSATPTPSPTVSTSGTSGPSQSTQATVPTAKASDAVVSYLRALGAGDATTALSLAASAPTGDTTFLTNGVLAAATAGKLSNVQVADVSDPNATSVSASYTLAGAPVSATFDVTRVGDQFRLNDIAASVDLSRMQRSGAPVKLAGVTAPGSVVSLFPGVYAVTAANRNLSYGSVKVTVTDLGAQTPAGGKLAISSAGKSAIIKAAKSKYSWCLKQKSVRPSGCGFAVRVPGGVKLRTSTIKWTKRGGANFGSAKLSLQGATYVEAKMAAKVHFYARDARISRRYWYKDVSLRGFSALMTGSKISISYY